MLYSEILLSILFFACNDACTGRYDPGNRENDTTNAHYPGVTLPLPGCVAENHTSDVRRYEMDFPCVSIVMGTWCGDNGIVHMEGELAAI